MHGRWSIARRCWPATRTSCRLPAPPPPPSSGSTPPTARGKWRSRRQWRRTCRCGRAGGFHVPSVPCLTRKQPGAAAPAAHHRQSRRSPHTQEPCTHRSQVAAALSRCCRPPGLLCAAAADILLPPARCCAPLRRRPPPPPADGGRRSSGTCESTSASSTAGSCCTRAGRRWPRTRRRVWPGWTSGVGTSQRRWGGTWRRTERAWSHRAGCSRRSNAAGSPARRGSGGGGLRGEGVPACGPAGPRKKPRRPHAWLLLEFVFLHCTYVQTMPLHPGPFKEVGSASISIALRCAWCCSSVDALDRVRGVRLVLLVSRRA